MPRAAITLALATLTSCTPPSPDPPRLSYELVLPSRRLDQLLALPNAAAFAVGRNPDHDHDTFFAFADPEYSQVLDRAGSRITTTLLPNDHVAILVDGFESSPLDPPHAPLLQLLDPPDVLDSRDLSPTLPSIDTIAPLTNDNLLLTASHDSLTVIAPDGSTRWTWPHDDVQLATVLDDVILATGTPAGQPSDIPAPIALWRLSPDGAPIDSTTIAIPDRNQLTALAAAGTDAYAIAMILEPTLPIPHTSLVRIHPDGTVHVLATSDEHDDVQWHRALAADPNGGVIVIGEAPNNNTILLHAFGPDDEPRWTLELDPPRTVGAPPLSDVCGVDPNLRVAIASDGGIVVGGYDGCTSSWLVALDPTSD